MHPLSNLNYPVNNYCFNSRVTGGGCTGIPAQESHHLPRFEARQCPHLLSQHHGKGGWVAHTHSVTHSRAHTHTHTHTHTLTHTHTQCHTLMHKHTTRTHTHSHTHTTYPPPPPHTHTNPISPRPQVNAKLSDYGIACYATESGLIQPSGTAGYKAPELLKSNSTYNEKVDF